MKWLVLMLLVVVPWVSAQTLSRKFDASKKSSFEGKTFNTKSFDTGKTYETKQFDTKQAPTRQYPTRTNTSEGQLYTTKNFEPAGEKQSWWKKLFARKTSDENAKVYATTNAVTRMNPRLKEQLDHVEPLKRAELPKIRATPEEINRLK